MLGVETTMIRKAMEFHHSKEDKYPLHSGKIFFLSSFD